MIGNYAPGVIKTLKAKLLLQHLLPHTLSVSHQYTTHCHTCRLYIHLCLGKPGIFLGLFKRGGNLKEYKGACLG